MVPDADPNNEPIPLAIDHLDVVVEVLARE
jgi:hypothetical protein